MVEPIANMTKGHHRINLLTPFNGFFRDICTVNMAFPEFGPQDTCKLPSTAPHVHDKTAVAT